MDAHVVSVQVGRARNYPGPPPWHSAFVKKPVAGRAHPVSGVASLAQRLALRPRVGSALLEVTYERGPCVKISRRWSRLDFTRRVETTGRTGWYHRVVEAGELGAGDAYELVERSPCAPTVLEAMRAR